MTGAWKRPLVPDPTRRFHPFEDPSRWYSPCAAEHTAFQTAAARAAYVSPDARDFDEKESSMPGTIQNGKISLAA